METKILVLYVGVAGIRWEDIEYFTQSLAKKIIPSTFQGETIVIPIQSTDSRIECINPKYITEVELIKEHTEMIKKLQEQLHIQHDILKQKNNE
jgi:hypothetical protein